MMGVLVTCNEREKLCIREAYNVLNEVGIDAQQYMFNCTLQLSSRLDAKNPYPTLRLAMLQKLYH